MERSRKQDFISGYLNWLIRIVAYCVWFVYSVIHVGPAPGEAQRERTPRRPPDATAERAERPYAGQALTRLVAT